MKPAVSSCSVFTGQMMTFLRTLFVSGLLLFYLAGNTPFTFIHQVIHPDEVSPSHSPSEEVDPCHRSIYHGDDKGCKHEFHVEKVSGCSLFHTVVYTDQIVFASGHSEVIHFAFSHRADFDTGVLAQLRFPFLSRGPPSRTSM